MSMLLIMVVVLSASAQGEKKEKSKKTFYFTVDEMPNLLRCLPGPPDTIGADFYYDVMRYMWGKEQRLDKTRADIARKDAAWTHMDLISQFCEPLGLELSKTETPEIWKLLEVSLWTTDQMRVAPKAYYKRKRPFVRFHEHILTNGQEEDEEVLGSEGSYPSGHTARGWTAAMILSELCPDRSNALLARGFAYGESRVIVGAHWQSDVDASRLAASIGYCRLQTSPAYREQMKKAREEFAQKTGVRMKPSVADGIERKGADYYFTRRELPDLVRFLPAPPDTNGIQFGHDIMRYMWGKTMRHDEKRAEIAYRDATYGVDYIMREFSEPFGLEISKDGTPEIYKLLMDGTSTCDSICYYPKRYYMRRRPFMRFQEPSLKPEDEPSLSKNGSYPSGHTILGWGAALLLSEVNPDRIDTLMARGYMYGESRVIVGAHWQSDVDCGRLAASAAFMRLHTSERFLEQMRKAQKEFARLKNKRQKS